MSQVIKLEYDLSHPIYEEVRTLILYQILSWLQTGKKAPSSSTKLATPPSPTTPSPHPSPSSAFVPSGEELMREMWFTSRDNVNMLCEICRWCFLVPSSEAILIKNAIDLYWGWIASPEPPLFIQAIPAVGQGVAEDASFTLGEGILDTMVPLIIILSGKQFFMLLNKIFYYMYSNHQTYSQRIITSCLHSTGHVFNVCISEAMRVISVVQYTHKSVYTYIYGPP